MRKIIENEDFFLVVLNLNRFKKIRSNKKKSIKFFIPFFINKNKEKIKSFEQGGNDLFKMLELQYLGKIDSWAIRWCYSQFINSSYSVTPKISMIQNNGFSDGVGVHNFGKGYCWQVKLAEAKINDLEAQFNIEISNHFKKYHDISFYTRIGYFLRKWGGYNFIKNLTLSHFD